ncbi:MAG: ABC transporter permease subunit [bacterium]
MEAARVRGQPLGPVRAAGLLPAVAEVASRRLVGIVGGIVVVERVFSQPGLGDLLWQAVVLRDVPVALGSALTLALGATAARWALDLLRLWAEPRLWGPA